MGTASNPKALGWGDPRKLKHFLEENGVSCWLDIEQMGQVGKLLNLDCVVERNVKI